METKDGLPPMCVTRAGCPVPPAGLAGERVLRAMDLMADLAGLLEGAAVLGVLGVTRYELRLMACVQREARRLRDENSGGGEGG